ncbi:MAG: hypothetical protein ACRCT6_10580, partial [Notoacmeibacter sp.]
ESCSFLRTPSPHRLIKANLQKVQNSPCFDGLFCGRILLRNVVAILWNCHRPAPGDNDVVAKTCDAQAEMMAITAWRALNNRQSTLKSAPRKSATLKLAFSCLVKVGQTSFKPSPAVHLAWSLKILRALLSVISHFSLFTPNLSHTGDGASTASALAYGFIRGMVSRHSDGRNVWTALINTEKT